MALAVRHLPVIKRDRVNQTYKVCCTCGETSTAYVARRSAEWALNKHVLTLPKVPTDQQCKQPRQHDRRVWEPCALCAGQDPLF